MYKIEEYAIEKKLVRESDGAIGYTLDGKLHSLEHAALVYPKETKLKPEYYVFGIKYEKEKWLEIKNGGDGLPFFKQASMKIR